MVCFPRSNTKNAGFVSAGAALQDQYKTGLITPANQGTPIFWGHGGGLCCKTDEFCRFCDFVILHVEMIDFAADPTVLTECQAAGVAALTGGKHHEFCIENEKLCIKNEELYIKSCIQTFALKMRNVVFKNDEFCRRGNERGDRDLPRPGSWIEQSGG